MADWEVVSNQLKRLEKSLEEYEMRQDIFNRKIGELEKKKEKLLELMHSDGGTFANTLSQMEVREAVIELDDECIRVKKLMKSFGTQIDDLLTNAEKLKGSATQNNESRHSSGPTSLEGIFSILGSPLVRQLALDMISGFLKGKGEMNNAKS